MDDLNTAKEEYRLRCRSPRLFQDTRFYVVPFKLLITHQELSFSVFFFQKDSVPPDDLQNIASPRFDVLVLLSMYHNDRSLTFDLTSVDG